MLSINDNNNKNIKNGGLDLVRYGKIFFSVYYLKDDELFMTTTD